MSPGDCFVVLLRRTPRNDEKGEVSLIIWTSTGVLTKVGGFIKIYPGAVNQSRKTGCLGFGEQIAKPTFEGRFFIFDYLLPC